ncbi:TraB/GumN family protein [Bermanella marisrubri]|nr:TraB/GumN family protein [Bermanella marisrubri]
MRALQSYSRSFCLILFLFPYFALAEIGDGLLWRIHKPGHGVHYLFATIHVADPRVKALNPRVRRAFQESKTVCLELIPDREMQVGVGRAMFLSDGSTLDQLIGNGLFGRLSLLLNDRGISPIQAAHLKPWAAMIMITRPDQQAGYALDEHLYHKALHEYKKVCALETLNEQLGIFDDLSLDDQTTLLEDSMNYLKNIQEINQELIDTYLSGDLDKLYKLGTSMQGSDDELAARLRKRLIDERNLTMADRMLPYLKDDKSFIAVGALHLPGTYGLLNLLREQGYLVTPPEIQVNPW